MENTYQFEDYQTEDRFHSFPQHLRNALPEELHHLHIRSQSLPQYQHPNQHYQPHQSPSHCPQSPSRARGRARGRAHVNRQQNNQRGNFHPHTPPPQYQENTPHHNLSRSQPQFGVYNSSFPTESSRKVYRSKQVVPARPGSKAFTLPDRFLMSNPDVTRRLRDCLTLSLMEIVRKYVSPDKPFTWKTYAPSKKHEVTNEEDFDNCDGKREFGALLFFVRNQMSRGDFRGERVNKDIFDSIERLKENRHEMSHGHHLNSTKGRRSEEIDDLFDKAKQFLRCLSPEHVKTIEELENLFKELKGISSQSKLLLRMEREFNQRDATKILNYLEDNLDDKEILNLISGVIAPRIKNVVRVLSNQIGC